MGIHLTILVLIAVLMTLWIGFVMQEQTNDERELLHNVRAGRIAYLSGILVLTIALIIQGFMNHIDPWITLALSVMIVSKITIRFYLDTYT